MFGQNKIEDRLELMHIIIVAYGVKYTLCTNILIKAAVHQIRPKMLGGGKHRSCSFLTYLGKWQKIGNKRGREGANKHFNVVWRIKRMHSEGCYDRNVPCSCDMPLTVDGYLYLAVHYQLKLKILMQMISRVMHSVNVTSS